MDNGFDIKKATTERTEHEYLITSERASRFPCERRNRYTTTRELEVGQWVCHNGLIWEVEEIVR